MARTGIIKKKRGEQYLPLTIEEQVLTERNGNQYDHNLKYSLFNRSNPNLLINGDFKVNQRGLTDYVKTDSYGWQYTVDRWAKYSEVICNAHVYPINSGLRITTSESGTNFTQFIENGLQQLLGKTVTMSAKINNNIFSLTATIPGTMPTVQNTNFAKLDTPEGASLRIELRKVGTIMYLACGLWLGAGTYELGYIKLEVGSIATAYNPRPYAEELALCQRYYICLKNLIAGTTAGEIGIARNATAVRFFVYLPTTMRTKPSVCNSNAAMINVNTGAITSLTNNVLTVLSARQNLVVLNFATTRQTSGQIYYLTDTNGLLKIELDAEIY